MKVRAYIASRIQRRRPRSPSAIREAVAQLPDNPAIGRPGRLIDTRELIVTGTPYLLPYTVVGEEIVILRMLHGAQQ